MKTKLKQFWWWGMGGVLATAPVALVIACGTTEAAPAATPKFTSTVQPTADSTHENVRWTGTVSLTGISNPNDYTVEYLAGNYTTQTAAAAASGWQTALPTKLEFAHAQRHLWVRAVPSAAASGAATQYEDITTASGVQGVKSDVNALPSVATAKTRLEAGTITGTTLATLAIADPLAGTTGLPLVFEVRVGARQWVPGSTFSSEIASVASSWEPGSPLAIAGRLRLTGDSKLFIFTPPNIVNYDTAAVVALLDASFMVDATIKVGTLAYDPNSAHDAAASTGAPIVEGADAAQYDRFTYLSGNYPTLESANSATTWSDTVPALLPYAKEDRYLWVKAIPAASANPRKYQPIIADLTTASGVRAVKSNVNAAPAYAGVTLSSIKFEGESFLIGINSVSKLPNLAGAPELGDLPLATEWRVNNGAWVSFASFRDARATIVNTYARGTPLNFEARLVLTGSAADYAFTPPAVQTIDATPFYNAFQNYFYWDWGAFLSKDIDLENSTHDNVKWINIPQIKGPGAQDYAFEYLVTTSAITGAEANRLTGWSTTLPTQISPFFGQRYLYTRIVNPADGQVVETPAPKPGSNLKMVRTNVNAMPSYQALSLADAHVEGTTIATLELILPNLPFELPLTYELSTDGGTTVVAFENWAQLRDAFTASYVRGTPVILVVRLALRQGEDERYVFTPPRPTVVNTQVWYDLLNATP